MACSLPERTSKNLSIIFSLLYLSHNGGKGSFGFVENYAVPLLRMRLVTCFKSFAEVNKCFLSFVHAEVLPVFHL